VSRQVNVVRGFARPRGSLPREPFWPAQMAVAVALALYVTLPHRLTMVPSWVLPGLEVMLLLPLALTTPHRAADEHMRVRHATVALVGTIGAANALALVLLVHYLLQGGRATGGDLLVSAVTIWLTNVLVFALWYWELDQGGPGSRAASRSAGDFRFPQQQTALDRWAPAFVDYLYLSFTNATALSPTDTVPLSAWAKLLMMLQALVSLLTLVLVAAHAVNVLG
jgi:uncharacterized membrane protein